MRTDVLKIKLLRGMVAAAVGAAIPRDCTEMQSARIFDRDASVSATDFYRGPAVAVSDQPMQLTIRESATSWDKKLEREFRSLARLEAKGTLQPEQLQRLNELSHMRDVLLNPVTADELQAHLKRDELLKRMDQLLREYVEFREGAAPKGPTA